jgi:chemotaxis protein methyltransferase CheR
MTPGLSPQVHVILCALFEERAGLRYSIDDRELVENKLRDLVLERGFDSYLDYYYFLRYDPAGEAEITRAIDALVVGETYFFRELPALRQLVLELKKRVETGARVRVWSSACSTGEEPITLMMLLAAAGLDSKVEVVASDICERSLERARNGKHGLRSLRGPPPPDLAPFLKNEGTTLNPRDDLRARIRWEKVNLLDRAAIERLGTFDAVLCRNVLIYFSDETARTVVNALSERLTPNGWLLVGVSESLLRLGTSLRCQEHGGVFVYVKETS